MPRANIYVNNENWERYEREENKSGLINRLLSVYYGRGVYNKEIAAPKKKSIVQRAENVAKGIPISESFVENAKKGKIEVALDPCPHGYAKGMCKKADCNRKYAK